MRHLIHAAFLAGLLVPVGGTAFAADLDYNYEQGPPPPPPVVRVLPPRPFPRRVVVVPPYAVGPRPYGRPEGYGYDYDRERYEHSERHVSRYGYDHPRAEPREPYGEPRREYGPRERYDRYGEGRPYADPLGHDRRGGYDRGPGPDERGGRDPYDRG